MNFIARLRALLRDTSGQDLLEYALLVALIALVCVAVITSTGTNVQSIFSKISAALSTARRLLNRAQVSMADRTKGGQNVSPPSRSLERTDEERAMNMMRNAVDLLLKSSVLIEESGQDLLEYALLVALIALVAVGAVTTVGTTINTVFWTYISGVMSAI